MKRASISRVMVGAAAIGIMGSVNAQQTVTLTIESWRNDDLSVWRSKIIPAFEKAHPNIKVRFTPSAPTEYNAALNSKLEAGTAGDLITCRPFDAALDIFNKGKLVSLNDLQGMENFSPVAKTAWSTDDGKTTFCMPMASVIHGFIYNKDAFDKVGVKPPTTVDEFFAVLNKIKTNGAYVPLAIGTKDGWETATMGYQNIAPNYYKGEEGRKALVAGKAKLTDPQWVEPFRVMAKWKPFLSDGFQSQTYPDSQNQFTLGRAAIYPAGSWEIPGFQKQATFNMGVFMPVVQKAGDKCYISDHPDIALGVNAKSKNIAEAKIFANWVGSVEFAKIYSNALPGFFSLNKNNIELENPLAKEFVSWRGKCESTIRHSYQILSRGTPNLENEYWVLGSSVINGTITPESAAQKMQSGLESWYKPGK